MKKMEYINTVFNWPTIEGDELGIVQPFLEFTYTGEKLSIPSTMAIILDFTGEKIEFGLSFSIKMMSYFKVNKWLSKNDMHNAHLKMIAVLQEHLNDKLMDIRLRNIPVPVPTLDQSINLMGNGRNVLVKFIIDFASN